MLDPGGKNLANALNLSPELLAGVQRAFRSSGKMQKPTGIPPPPSAPCAATIAEAAASASAAAAAVAVPK
eukprot:2939615-Pyramimonas_sp.AAC.1